MRSEERFWIRRATDTSVYWSWRKNTDRSAALERQVREQQIMAGREQVRVSDHGGADGSDRTELEFAVIGCRQEDNYALVVDNRIAAIVTRRIRLQQERQRRQRERQRWEEEEWTIPLAFAGDEIDEISDILEARKYLDDCVEAVVGSNGERCQSLRDRMRRLRVILPLHPATQRIEDRMDARRQEEERQEIARRNEQTHGGEVNNNTPPARLQSQTSNISSDPQGLLGIPYQQEEESQQEAEDSWIADSRFDKWMFSWMGTEPTALVIVLFMMVASFGKKHLSPMTTGEKK